MKTPSSAFARVAGMFVSFALLGSIVPAHAEVVFTWQYSRLYSNSTAFNGSSETWDVRTASSSGQYSTSARFAPPGGIASAAAGSVSLLTSLLLNIADPASAGGTGSQFSHTASAADSGKAYASTSNIVETSLGFTVTSPVVVSGVLNSAAYLDQNSERPTSTDRFWNFVVRDANGSVQGIGASQAGPMTTMTLQPGSYVGYTSNTVYNQSCASNVACNWTQFDQSDMDIFFHAPSNIVGATPEYPVLPEYVTPERSFYFREVFSRQWVDPPVASGYDFATTDGSTFTKIIGLPAGFDELFEILVGSTSLGMVGPNNGLDFVSLLGHGVDSFSIRNIKPGVDPNSPTAFPIALEYDREFASFTMTPAEITDTGSIPEPATLALLGLSLAGLGFSRRKQ